MGMFNKLSSLLSNKKDNNSSDDGYLQTVNKCLVKTKLNKTEYKLFAIYYYKGSTSYRSFFKYAFRSNISKIRDIIDKATKKASKGCNIDLTYVRFYLDNLNYIDIPFDIFSEKKDMRLSRRNTKVWNKNNIIRLIKNNPTLRDFDNGMISESELDIIIVELLNESI